MKIVFFSDVHGNIFSFNQFLLELDDINPDIVVFGGDVYGYYYHGNEILSHIINRRFLCVKGNHDDYFLSCVDNRVRVGELVEKYGFSYALNVIDYNSDELEVLSKWPDYRQLLLNEKKILVVHGSLKDPLSGRIYPDTDIKLLHPELLDFDIVLLGHSHHKMCKIIDGTLIVNAGSLGQQRDGKGCSYALIDTVDSSVIFNVVNYEVSKLQKLVKTYDPEKKVNYDVLTR